MTQLTQETWDVFLSQYPNAHILQTSPWAELKGGFGWTASWVQVGALGAQILFRRLPLGFTLAYIPKGPVGGGLHAGPKEWEALWPAVDAACKARHSIFLKVEPDRWEDDCPDGQPPANFHLGFQTIQPPRTLLVDLRGDEEQVLGRMKQKTRYNVRLAQKKGVLVYPSADVDGFHQLMRVTEARDRFSVHSRAYYRRAYDLFHPRGECELFLAEFEGRRLGGVMVFAHGNRAWYFYGASANDHRDVMPTYILQWEAMRWARALGCEEYDLWGVPDADEATLEEHFTTRGDGLWGVYRFKRGFGGRLRRAAGPWDRVYIRPLYAFFRWWSARRGAAA